MTASQISPPPSLRVQLRVETLEDRWTLAGLGLLDLSIGSPVEVRAAAGKDKPIRSAVAPSASSVGNVPRGTVLTATQKIGQGAATPAVQAPSASAFSGSQISSGVMDSTAIALAPPSNFIGQAELGNSSAGVSVPGNDVHPAGANSITPAVNAASVGTTATTSNALAAPSATDSSSNAVGVSVPSAQPAVSVPNTPPAVVGPTSPQVARITALNRNTAGMMGGWNPGLRSIMVMDDGSRWFAAEQGANIEVNSAIVYYKLGPTGWKQAGSVMLPAGIQQNLATITNGRMIYSYGCAPGAIVEAWFDTTRPRWNLSTGNAILTSGHALNPGVNSNYIGAAWHNNTRIVWWTSVGENGSGGSWKYAFNAGRGWNGPIVSGLNGYNDVGYVRAQFDERGRIRMIGEAYQGQFPSGQRYLVATTVVLGNAPRWTPLMPNIARSPLDLWQENSTAPTQLLFRITPTKVAYSFGGGSALKPTVFKALEARFIADQDHVGLVLAYKNSVEVRLIPRSQASGFIDWNAIQPTTIAFPKALQAAGASAIWNVDESKQPNASNQLEFAICGAYPVRDNLIYYFAMNQS